MSYWTQYIGISLVYLIFVYLVLAVFIRTKGDVVRKAMTIFVCVLYTAYLFYSIPQLMGWPSAQEIPDERLVVLATNIQEPDQNSEGYFCLWLKSYDGKPPRSYILPYTKERHKKIHEAYQELKDGQLMMVRGKKRRTSEGESESCDQLEFEILNKGKLLRKE